jgi:hypothetical protein
MGGGFPMMLALPKEDKKTEHKQRSKTDYRKESWCYVHKLQFI